uniref:Uncharacterized protein n=1 Tax=Acrobeloides nanus TaxID=290746 RepID=A0A914EDB3_9BILA
MGSDKTSQGTVLNYLVLSVDSKIRIDSSVIRMYFDGILNILSQDPSNMIPFCIEQPKILSSYQVGRAYRPI